MAVHKFLIQTINEHFSKTCSNQLPQRASEREAVDFIVKRKNNHSPVGVFHFNVASFAMNFSKTESFQRFQNLPTGKQRKFHIANSTISRPRFAVSISSGSR